ncbi:hypothetical protein BD324DRAFT_619326 [Kockovaella imperatae]|uniref:Serine/threonine-protein kinase Tel1 n=1 Tax=Kockovaella imperatae TaxID=4999 RepID=A0A1Y1UMR3_9TREE|nr:hypothetical protein BD324DRAFT_619326 [Kockovaella imperatae]ORX39340.1 hypothetical protein BD324DRAFT_619326 [Kockovaella imperatae]
MSVPAVSGLQGALKLYGSDKVKERADGHTRIRGIFSDRENLRVFQESARRDGGAGWVALFQCLFQTVIMEKRVFLRSATAQAEKRLADAISLVRWMTERSVHLLSGKPFMALFTHMVHLLVHASRIFKPASLDYAKALRCLLRYPPHLANLDETGWRLLMSICWSDVLGDTVTLEDEWDETSRLEEEDIGDEIDSKDGLVGHGSGGIAKVQASSVELATLIPTLMSSPAAPLIPALPAANDLVYHHQASLGYRICEKIHRFLSQRRTNESVELNILRSLNMILETLELNCRHDFVMAGRILLPQLAGLWETGSRAIREQALIALRFFLNFCESTTGGASDEHWITDSSFLPLYQVIVDHLPREAGARWGIGVLDLHSIRLRLLPISVALKPFETDSITAGLGFTHDAAMAWTSLQFYAHVYFKVATCSPSSLTSHRDAEGDEKPLKRQKRSDPLQVLLRGCETGTQRGRLHHLQVCFFLVDQHWQQLPHDIQERLSELLLSLLDDEDIAIQDWAFLTLAQLATNQHEKRSLPTLPPFGQVETDLWKRAWAHSVRKAFGVHARSASHLGCTILSSRLVPQASTIDDVEDLMRSVDIQGPLIPADSVCAFMRLALADIRNDVRLYSVGMEGKLMTWIGKWTIVDSFLGRSRLNQHTPSDLLSVISDVCGLESHPMPAPLTLDYLPECAVVSRLIAEYDTQPIRAFGLRGAIPPVRASDLEAAPGEIQDLVHHEDEMHSMGQTARAAAQILAQQVERVLSELASTTKSSLDLKESGPIISPDKVKKGIDILLTAIAFQSLLILNGVRSDAACLDNASEALTRLAHLLQSTAYNVSSSASLWSGLRYILPLAGQAESVWPVMLRPDVSCGIRIDLFQNWVDAKNPGTAPSITLQKAIWRSQELAAAMKSLTSAALVVLSRKNLDTSTSENAVHLLQNDEEDDDFGEIRTTETDLMPHSREMTEYRRTKPEFIDLLVAFRIEGLLLSSSQPSIRDAQLVNTFLTAEGETLVTIGMSICRQIKAGSLRLSVSAFDLMLESLEEMMNSYAYSQDEGMIRLIATFLGVTAPLWISDQANDGEIGSRATFLSRSLVRKSMTNEIVSWRARLSVVLFIDEYLDYDPDMEAWHKSQRTQDMDVDDPSGPTDVIATSLVDKDLRVRFRGATSTAGLLYLSSIPASQHSPFYHETVNTLPREPKHWDSFITDLLWKLNCCVASTQLRAAAIYHLYEIPSSTDAYNVHLHLGLAEAAKRLGLAGISPLYLAHAPLIVSSQISSKQDPLLVPSLLCGFESEQAYALALLDSSAAMIVLAAIQEKASKHPSAGGPRASYDRICSAAEMSTESATIRYLGSIIARALTDRYSGLTSEDEFHPRDAFKRLQHLPGLTASALTKTLAPIAEEILGHILRLLESSSTNWMLEVLGERNDVVATVFSDIVQDAATPPDELSNLPPCSSIQDVLAGIDFLKLQVTVDSSKAVFLTLNRLFRDIHEAFLVSEQFRRVQAIALLLALHSDQCTNPVILETILLETTQLLLMPDLARAALSMLKWGFKSVRNVTIPTISLLAIFRRLGAAYAILSEGSDSMIPVADALKIWLLDQSPVWTECDNIRTAYQDARIVWKSELRAGNDSDMPPAFDSIIGQIPEADAAHRSELIHPLTSAMRQECELTAQTRNLDKVQHDTFWTLKDALGPEAPEDGVHAFLDLLHLIKGEIHPPSLNDQRQVKPFAPSQTKSTSKIVKPDASMPVRAAVVKALVKLASHVDHTLRFAAIDALRSIGSYVAPMIQAGHLQGSAEYVKLFASDPGFSEVGPKTPIVDLADIWAWLQLAQEPVAWISKLSVAIASSVQFCAEFYQAIRPYLMQNPTIARTILPHMVHAILLDPYNGARIGSNPREVLSSLFSAMLESPSTDEEITQVVISIVLHLREHRPPSSNGRLNEMIFESWLDIDNLLLSEASISGQAYATAMMFLELMTSGEGANLAVNMYDPRVQRIMYEAYSNLEDPDGFYAVKTRDVASALNRRLIHEGDHWRAFGLHGADIEAQTKESSCAPILAASKDLHRLGLNRISALLIASLRDKNALDDASSDSLMFDLAWRIGDWDLPTPSASTTSSHVLLYSALRAVHRSRDLQTAVLLVTKAIVAESRRLPGLGPQRITQVQKAVEDLLCLREIRQWLSSRVQSVLDGTVEDASIINDLKSLDSSFSFSLTQRLLAVRRSMIVGGEDREKHNVIGDITTTRLDVLRSIDRSCLLHQSRMARENGDIQAANNAVTAARLVEGDHRTDLLEDEFGQVLWAQKEHALSIQHLEQRLNVEGISGIQRATLTGRLAQWTSVAKYRTPDEIRSMFDEARLLAEVHNMTADDQGQICHDFAAFADSHQRILSRAPELEQLSMYIGRKGAELQSSTSATMTSKKSKPSSNSKSDAVERIEREIKEDEETMQELIDARNLYVKIALQMYARSLTLSDRHDDLTTQMLSLWLEHDRDQEISKAFAESLRRVPSHKFIFLGPQLAARLDRPKVIDNFNTLLSALMLRLSREHPYHILYQIITLAEGFALPAKNRRVSDGGAEGRAPAAAAILSELNNGEVSIAKTAVRQMKAFADRAIQWCLLHTKEEENAAVGGRLNLPPNFPLAKLVNLDIPIPTSPPTIDATCQYAGIPTFVRFRTQYQILGGLHRPKKMAAYDSRSVSHFQLYKGEDEVRQDAVMEQVFEMSNALLSRDRKTRERSLRFRTYVVIPLARSTGIMEFVGDSVGIGDWLKPAHHRYGQITKDIPADDFRRVLKPLQENEKTWSKLPAKFTEMLQGFHPVMRYFFTEKHRDPLAWFTMRLNYTRSAAVTSIIGWMLGIGDRHCSNILIDQVTGELVHIDFGIVFEDGQRLRIPEKVPFRLTNDMVDGFGITGVDGTFRRCSEQTLRVLRGSSALIMTVLEVFKHDPLYAWDADPDKMQRAQGGGRVNITYSASALERADRILAKIRQKLRDDISIEYRVNELIQEARSTENLAKIFIGWQPWF